MGSWRPRNQTESVRSVLADRLFEEFEVIVGEDLVDVGDDDERVLDLAHALDEFGADAGAEGGGGMMSWAAISKASFTASTTTPATWVSPSA